MLSIKFIFVLIVLWRLSTVRKYQVSGISSDFYTTHIIPPRSRSLLRDPPSFVSKPTASSSYMFNLIVINGSLTTNKG
ncbi:hypothetical protein Y032_0290g1531 [Ancylostoma ceylanicum]|uniref:Secreted protein n=1 Tax=Ancylostoma ceylanicum TaxID=53326 RepID=A0A016S588_9BILA|nr:hypothetical protein Y032_0290g1531 [Ancylostoma ceylanicum]